MRRAAVVLVAVVACGQDARTTAAIAARQAAEAEAAKRAAAVRAVPDGTGAPGATGHTLDAATLLREVFGAQPGLGPLFAGVQLGASASGFLPDDARARVEAFKAATGASVEFEFGARLDRIVVTGETTSSADPFLVIGELSARWGRPTRLTDDTMVWLDEAAVTRLRLTTDDTAITVAAEPYATLRRLIAPANPDRFGFEPVPLLGRPLAEVLPSVPGATRNGTAYTWTMPPLADGADALEASMIVDDDRVVHVALVLTPVRCESVVAEVSAKFGRATPGGDPKFNVTQWVRGDRTIVVNCDDEAAALVAELR